MKTIYVIADTHFGHTKLVASGQRPFSSIEDHDRELIARWNATVNPTDTVWLLGDVAIHKGGIATLARLNGIKNLVMGNHDAHLELLAPFFNKIVASFEYDNCVLTHIPIHNSQFRRYEFNIHGHTHGKDAELSLRHVCVSAECVNYTPVPLRQLINGRRTAINHGIEYLQWNT